MTFDMQWLCTGTRPAGDAAPRNMYAGAALTDNQLVLAVVEKRTLCGGDGAHPGVVPDLLETTTRDIAQMIRSNKSCGDAAAPVVGFRYTFDKTEVAPIDWIVVRHIIGDAADMRAARAELGMPAGRQYKGC
jgi:hypothetical protein